MGVALGACRADRDAFVDSGLPGGRPEMIPTAEVASRPVSRRNGETNARGREPAAPFPVQATVTPVPAPARCADGPLEPAALGEAFDGLDPEWVAADLMDRVSLDADRAVWLAGDTFRGDVDDNGRLEPGATFVHNSAVLEDRGCFEVIETFGQGPWIPSPGPGEWSWPQEALVVDGNVVVFAVEIVTAPNETYGFNFEEVGGSLAIYDLDDLGGPHTLRSGVPAVDGRPFGWGAIRQGRFVHMYAHHQAGTFAARVSADDLAAFELWRFWDGDRWVDDVRDAAVVSPNRLRVFWHGDSLRAAALPFLGTELHLFQSDHPTGPWELTDVIDLSGLGPDVPSYAYAPIAVHTRGTEVTISVNFLPMTHEDTMADLSRYGPRFITIEPTD